MEEKKKDLPMNWYKFLIYVALVLGAITSAYNGVSYIMGRHYRIAELKDAIYQQLPAMKIVDIAMGIVFFAIAVLCIITRQQLARYKANGPKLLLAVYASNFLYGIIYAVATSVVSGVSITMLLDGNMLVRTVVVGIILAANKVYFDKRSHLFVY